MKRKFLIAALATVLGLLLGGCTKSPETSQTVAPSSEAPPPADSQPPAAPSTVPPAPPPMRSIAPRPPSASQTVARPAGSTPAPSAAVTPKAPPVPRDVIVTLPVGTAIAVRTVEALSTKTATSGQSFEATLAEDLREDGQLIAKRGARAEGRVVESDPGGRVKGTASLTLQLTGLRLANGTSAELTTGTVGRTAGKSTKKDALKVGIASGVGAAIGAIAGGGKGAAIGAGAGAAGGTGVVLGTRGEAATVPSETVLTFTLRNPITVRNP